MPKMSEGKGYFENNALTLNNNNNNDDDDEESRRER